MITIRGKTALVTGSSRGIGRGIALKLAECGVSRVGVHYLKNKAAAEQTATSLRERGAEPLVLQADVTKIDDIAGMFATVGRSFGGLDIFVSNAALGALKPALDLSWSKWDITMEICARAFLLCAQEAMPLMKTNGGHMIAISSLGSRKYLPNYTAIGAAKAALGLSHAISPWNSPSTESVSTRFVAG